ncbi:hypothetical protein KI387_040918, partial [Taxus chinensis]
IEDATSFYSHPSKVTKEEDIHHVKEEEPLQQLFGVMDQPLGSLEAPTAIAK